MKIVVISDTHGNIANIKNALGFAQKIAAGGLVHCGDWDNQKACEILLSYKIPLYSVSGNADIDPNLIETLKDKSEKFEENYLRFEISRKKIGVIHNLNANGRQLISDRDIVFCGHTHVQFERQTDGVRTVNPGALENKNSFAVYDTGSDRIEFVNE